MLSAVFLVWDPQPLVHDLRFSRPGVVTLRKVKAHVSNYDHQSQELTVGNTRADQLAKTCAKEKLRTKVGAFHAIIAQAVALQIHLVTTMISRTEHFMHDDLARLSVPKLRIAVPCACAPLRRLRVKTSPVCTCAFSTVVEVGKVETTFIDIVRAGDPIPANLAQRIHNHYFKYHRLRSIPRVLGTLCVIQNFESVTSEQDLRSCG